MDFPPELKYTREHEWVLLENGVATVGITEYATDQLGDIVFLELPEEGDAVTKDEAMGSIESVKAVSDLYAPVSGKVVEANNDLADSPDSVNDDPYGDAWMVRIQVEDKTELEDLMDAEEYAEYVEEELEDEEEEEDDYGEDEDDLDEDDDN